MALLSRLSKDRGRVLCGMIGCGAELGLVVDYPSGPAPSGKWVVWLGPGWNASRAERVWMMRPYAERKVRTGQQPRSRRRPGDAVTLTGWLPHNLPIEARCPVCGQRQALDPLALEVDPLQVPYSAGEAEPGELLVQSVARARIRCTVVLT